MRNDKHHDSFEAQQEILAILSRMQTTDAKEAVTETASLTEEEDIFAIPAAPATTTTTDSSLVLEPEVQVEQPKVSRTKQRKVSKEEKIQETALEKEYQEAVKAEVKILVTSTEDTDGTTQVPLMTRIAQNLLPQKSDPASEIVRKCIFLLSLVVFLVSLGFLSYYMALEPSQVTQKNHTYAAIYNNTATKPNVSNESSPFEKLQAINKDVAGWLSFHSTDTEKFLNIDLPVVWCGDNETYLSKSFDGKYSRSGTLFFEQNNVIKQGVSNKVSIIYGHNMASGTMFAPLNKLIGSVYRARSAAVLKLDTFFADDQYKVFAIIISDESAQPAHRFGYLRTSFADDADFMNYVDELRARSLFDYPVDVQVNDELLILSTCTNKSQVKLGNGRLAVVARRVRPGENASVDTAKITKNNDVIMPYAWYTAQNASIHPFYTQTDYIIPGTNTTTTNPITENTTTTIEDGTTTSDTGALTGDTTTVNGTQATTDSTQNTTDSTSADDGTTGTTETTVPSITEKTEPSVTDTVTTEETTTETSVTLPSDAM